ncbi:hypothetical protein FB45DRAFT_928101 [Roridomyces roridus]|uniref:Phosphatidylglycerol/phosphatidylinositol transfer protein n=1 Tax=Roridomyces roridus TaxID=1738132 RepID=A0AAD7BHF9_9AGAR|nr:hypothetical protein FB45DRAFT_928101 [Roridomyces roridus]
MKLLQLPLVALLATTALAQNCVIGGPKNGTHVKPGKNITVEVDRPDSLTGSTEVAIIIGFMSCVGFPNSQCPPPDELIGSVLYNGPYNPQFHTNVTPTKPPYQNFSVMIPTTARKGVAQLSVTHVSLVGAGPFPLLESLNVSLIVQ